MKVWTGILALCAAIAAAHDGRAAEWISSPEVASVDAARNPVALQFRRDFDLEAKPRTFPVQVSADQRFVLYVNGRRVAQGPARGDLQNWRYEALDLAPYLRRGANVIAAQVWSDGKFAPLAQLSAGSTGFYLAATESRQAALIESGPNWRVRRDASRTVNAGMAQLLQQIGPTFYAAGAPETINAAQQARGWKEQGAAISDWRQATPAQSGGVERRLVADRLPQMRYQRISSGRVVRATGVVASAFPQKPVTIPAGSEVSILIDAGRVLAAYPVLRTSKGAGAEIKLTYTEALYDPANRRGGSNGSRARFPDRAHVGQGQALGLTDSFKPDGAQVREFAPFWWRAWRFVEIKVKTGAEPLVLDGFDTYETGYPFEQKGRFVSSDAQLNEIFSVGWRTARLDAHETYMDTAYWEQLQYIGDTRIQMLVSYDVAGDPRLAVQALDAFDSSRPKAGIPQAAWPESNDNLIPPFALLWIGSLHDYWMRQPDTSVVTRNLAGVRAVLDWYAGYVRDTGLLSPTPGWPFVDWVGDLDGTKFRNGRGPDSCVITLQYYGALQEAAELEAALGEAGRKAQDLAQADRVKRGLEQQCWDSRRGLYADTPDKTNFSQHANALAVLYDVAPKARQREILDRIIAPGGGIAPPPGIAGATYYFSFYLARALDHAGLGDRYIDLLSTWRKLLGQNFTTWPEQPDPSRSDSHAWSAHPTSGLLTYVAGISPASPGFATVNIAPHLGRLKSLDAAMAHPKGLIETDYRLAAGTLTAQIVLPPGVSGKFEWQGRQRSLKPGKNTLRLPSQGVDSVPR